MEECLSNFNEVLFSSCHSQASRWLRHDVAVPSICTQLCRVRSGPQQVLLMLRTSMTHRTFRRTSHHGWLTASRPLVRLSQDQFSLRIRRVRENMPELVLALRASRSSPKHGMQPPGAFCLGGSVSLQYGGPPSARSPLDGNYTKRLAVGASGPFRLPPLRPENT